MFRLKTIPAIFLGLLFLYCTKPQEPIEEAPFISITCPGDVTFSTSGNAYFYDIRSVAKLYTNCDQGGLTLKQLSGPSDGCFPIGTSEVRQQVTDACGNVSDCSFSVTVRKDAAPCTGGTGPNDFRNALVGIYIGTRKCGQAPASDHVLQVCYDPERSNCVLVDNESVQIDPNCACFPGAYISGYRNYAVQFSGGNQLTLTSQVYAALGNPNQPPVCTFNGVKQP